MIIKVPKLIESIERSALILMKIIRWADGNSKYEIVT